MVGELLLNIPFVSFSFRLYEVKNVWVFYQVIGVISLWCWWCLAEVCNFFAVTCRSNRSLFICIASMLRLLPCSIVLSMYQKRLPGCATLSIKIT